MTDTDSLMYEVKNGRFLQRHQRRCSGKIWHLEFSTKRFFRNSENEQKGSWHVQGWM